MSQLKKNPVGKALAFGAVLLLLVVGQSLATDDKKDRTVKGRIEELEALVASLRGDVADLQDLLQHFSRPDDGNDIYVTGANLHVVNGTGSTDRTNSLGNIIIGYNEERTGNNVRTGSHMLVVGTEHNYLSYGGVVVGRKNTTSGFFASVSGGQGNTAWGHYASVSGGADNSADGECASVSGGKDNYASYYCASVSGGRKNWAGVSWRPGGSIHLGEYASVSGGWDNQAGGDGASVSGGRNNTAVGDYSTVSGGNGTTATEEDEHPDTHTD